MFCRRQSVPSKASSPTAARYRRSTLAIPTINIDIDRDGRGVSLTSAGGLQHVVTWLASRGTPRRVRSASAAIVDYGHASQMLGMPEVIWSSEAEKAVRNRARIHAVAPSVVAEARRLKAQGVDQSTAGRPSGLTVELDAHQAVNVAVMTLRDGYGACLFDEQGTGKTVCVIAAFDLLVHRDEADVLVVVAPKSMVPEWKSEFGRFTHGLYKVAIALGEGRRRAFGAGADVIVINYEGVAAQLPELKLLCKRSRVVLVVDESYNVKNAAASRSAALKALREGCTRAFVLCGTPAPNAAVDIVSQVDLVDFGYAFDGMNRVGEMSLAEIQRCLDDRAVYLRSLKTFVLPDLPTRQYTKVELDLEPVQAQLYARLAGDLVNDLKQTSDQEFEKRRTSFMARRVALLRVCSNPVGLFPDYGEVPAKVKALDGLLDNWVRRSGEKVVIWSWFKASLAYLADRYQDFGLVRVDGTVQDALERQESIRRFQEDPAIRIFLGNPAAAGAGLTLHRARLAVYESLSNQAAHYMQSLDRIHRRGQTADVEYVVLVSRATLEEAEYERLQRKSAGQRALLGDPPDSSLSRRAMLRELLPSLPKEPADGAVR